jgi:hypothetical protein
VTSPIAVIATKEPNPITIVIEENLSARNLMPQLKYLTSLQEQGAKFMTQRVAVTRLSRVRFDGSRSVQSAIELTA